MKIHIANVKEHSEDFHLEDRCVLKDLGDRAGEGAVEVDATVDPIGENWLVRGRVKAVFPFICDKCSHQFEGTLRGEFALSVLSRTVAGLEPDDEDEEEVIVLPAESQELDLTGKVMETLWLELPITLTCVSLGEKRCPRFDEASAGGADDGGETDPRWNILKELKRKMTTEEAGEADSGKSED